MTGLSAWEMAARAFEPDRHLWSVGPWRARLEATDRLRIDGPTASIAYTLPDVDLREIRTDAMLAPPDILASADREVTYTPYGAARRLIHARDVEILAAGPAGTGKSLAALFKVHVAAMLYPGLRALIVRKTLTSLGSTGLVTFREQVIPDARNAGLVRWYGGSQERAAAYLYVNGSEVVVAGLDHPDKIMSSEYDLIFSQEAIELKIGDWEAMLSRLRHGAMPWQQLIADCNPSYPQHWLKRRADEGTTRLLHSRHEDNPVLFDHETGELTPRGHDYIEEKLDKLTGVRYQRLRLGKWVAAEGVIYEDYDEEIHLIDRNLFPGEQLPNDWTRWWTVDFGYVHPFVAQCWAEDPDGRLWLEWEVYHTRRLVEQHAETILAQVTEPDPEYVHPENERRRAYHGRTWTGPRPRSVICDHDAEGRATLDAELGISTIPANKKVLEGIQAVQARLKTAGDGRPRILFLRDTVVERDPDLAEAGLPTSTIEEFPGYVWAQVAGRLAIREAPVKENDDGLDCARYIVAARDLGGRPNIRYF